MVYSGKSMAPAPMPPAVAQARDALAETLYRGAGVAFDGALVNLYPAASGAACKFHHDPDHGDVWARETCVVSGGEPRRFAFRPRADARNDDDRHAFHLFHGDVVTMRRDCQDVYQHGVLAADDDDTNDGARVSLVFKASIPRGPGGARGHPAE